MTRKLHLGTNVIGIYGGSVGSATVYLSIYHSESDAGRAYALMARRIANGNSIFSHYSIVQVKDTVVSFCVGKGLHHYFLTSKNALYWLTVDPAIAEMVSDDLVMSL